jgi:peptide/nickel transport system substrate-binding protein
VDWYSDAGEALLESAQLDEARKLVQASGYKGEEVVIIATKEYAELYNLAIVAQQVLKQIGVKSRLDVYDWPTVLHAVRIEKLRSLCAGVHHASGAASVSVPRLSREIPRSERQSGN